MAASMLTITSISVDRFLHVRFPFRYPRFATPRVAYLVIALVWTLAVIVGTMPVLQASKLSTGNHYRMACHVYFMQYEYRQYQLFYQGGLFLVCSAVSLAAYLYICLVAIRHRREIARIAPTCQLGEFRDEPSPGAARAPTASTDEDGSSPTGVSTISGTFQRLTHENRQGVNVAMTPRASRAKVTGSTAQPLGGTCLKTGSDKGGVILNPRQAGETEKPDQVTVVISDEDRKSVSSASGVAQTGTDTREPKELPSITAVVSMSPLVWSEKPMSVVLETPPTKTDYMDLGEAASRHHKTYQHVGIADLTNVPRSSLEPTLPDVSASDDVSRRLGDEENENQSTNQSSVDLTADETLPTSPKHSCHPSNLSEREEHLLDECPVVSVVAGTKTDASRVSTHHGKDLTSHYPEQPSKSAKGTSGVPNNLQSRHLDQPSTSSEAVLSSHLSLKSRSTPHIPRVPKCCEDNTSSPGSCQQHVRPPAPGAIVVTLYFFVFGLFFVLWSPTFLVLLFGVYADGELSWLRVLFPIGLLNSVCNVIVYALKCDEMRCVMKQILVGCFYRKCAETNICRGFPRAAWYRHSWNRSTC